MLVKTELLVLSVRIYPNNVIENESGQQDLCSSLADLTMKTLRLSSSSSNQVISTSYVIILLWKNRITIRAYIKDQNTTA